MIINRVTILSCKEVVRIRGRHKPYLPNGEFPWCKVSANCLCICIHSPKLHPLDTCLHHSVDSIPPPAPDPHNFNVTRG